MVDVYYNGVLCLCLPDCACCRACHKLIEDVDECPEPNEYHDKYKCDPNCEHYEEIWDENELKAELDKDEDNIKL